jgi:hypothetical protein
VTGFEYLVPLISLVAALGVAQALSGIAKLIHVRDKISISCVHLLWTLNILLWLVCFWWFSFALSTVDSWTPPLLIMVLIYAATIYFLLALLYPDDLKDGLDFREYFIDNRRWFFGSLLFLGLLDLLDSWIKYKITDFGGPPLVPYIIFMSVWILPSGVAIFTTNKRFHSIFAVIFFVGLLLYVRDVLFVIQ